MVVAFIMIALTFRDNVLFRKEFHFLNKENATPRELEIILFCEKLGSEIGWDVSVSHSKKAICSIAFFKRRNATFSYDPEFLDDFSMDVVKAIIAHEFGHIVNNDMDKTRILWSIYVLSHLSLAHFLYEQWFSSFDYSLLIQILLLILVDTLSLIFITFCDLLISRKMEYKADYYAYKLGFGKEIIEFFKQCNEEEPLWFIIIRFILSTHPSYNNRILRIERAMKRNPINEKKFM
jgi:hypothetical protein